MPTLFHFKVRSTAREPTFEGTETSSWSDVSKTLSAWSDALGWDDVNSVGDLSEEQRREATQHSLLGEVNAETWRELIFFPVVNPNTSQLNQGALQAVISGRGEQADIPDEALQSAQEMAERLLGNFDDEDSDDPDTGGKTLEDIAQMAAEKIEGAEKEDVLGVFKGLEEGGPPQGDSIPEKNVEIMVKGESGEAQMPDPGYPTKATGSVKQVDASTRTVMGYYADIGTLDSDQEVFAQGAFEDTIRRRGPEGTGRIKHLWMHDPFQPVGVPQVLREDEKGLYFESKIVDTQKGTDVLKLYEEEVITEHSVGFSRIDQEPQEDGTTLITEVQLWEGSSVVWGANPNTPVTGMKGHGPKKETLAQKAQAIRKALGRDLSEDTAAQVEVGLKQIESALRREETAEKTVDVLGGGADKTITIL